MKRGVFLCACLAVLCGVPLLAAPVEVTFWNLFGGGDGETMKTILDAYNKATPGVVVNGMTQDWGQYYTKLRTAVLGGTSPDLGVSHVTRLLEMKNNMIIVPLQDEAARLGVAITYDDYTSNVIIDTKMDGKYWAVPLDNLTQVLVYNKAILKEAGVVSGDALPKIDSLDGFIKMLNAVKAKKPDAIPLIADQSGFSPALTWFSLYAQLGGKDLLAPDLRKAAFDQAIAVKAMRDMARLYAFVPPNISDTMALFKTGKAAFYITGTWNIAVSIEAVKANFGVVAFPKLYAKKAVWVDSHSFILPNNPKRDDAHTKAALEFVKWFGQHNWMWAQAGHMPANKTSWTSKEFKALPFRSNYIESSTYGVAFQSTENVWLTFAAELDEPIEKMIRNGASAEDTVKEIRARLDASLVK